MTTSHEKTDINNSEVNSAVNNASTHAGNRNLEWPPLTKPPYSSSPKKMYKQALKEVHKLPSSIRPNLIKKRPRSSSDNERTNAGQQSDWIEQKKTTFKHPKNLTLNMEIDCSQNRYETLNNETEMFSLPNDSRDHRVALSPTDAEMSQLTPTV